MGGSHHRNQQVLHTETFSAEKWLVNVNSSPQIEPPSGCYLLPASSQLSFLQSSHTCCLYHLATHSCFYTSRST